MREVAYVEVISRLYDWGVRDPTRMIVLLDQ